MIIRKTFLGFQNPVRALVIGGTGGIGSSIAQAIRDCGSKHSVWTTSTKPSIQISQSSMHSFMDITEEESIISLVDEMQMSGYSPNLVIVCSGILRTTKFGPEKTWYNIEIENMRKIFEINTFGIALLGKHIIPSLPRKERSVFATLSARVGSISDNRLGGWYSYRSSKAAQNMLIKTLALEAVQKWKKLICISLHPGTVKTKLSQPFSSHIASQKIFSSKQCSNHLMNIISQLSPDHNGDFFAWDGNSIKF